MAMISSRFRGLKSRALEEVDPLLGGTSHDNRQQHQLHRCRRSQDGCESLWAASKGSSNILSCVGLPSSSNNGNSSKRVAKNHLVTLLVGEEQRAFCVEPQILDHCIVQCLLEKSEASMNRACSESVSISSISRSSTASSKRRRILVVDCDAILFEHILWLLSNDDPSLRYLNLDELMEFYS